MNEVIESDEPGHGDVNDSGLSPSEQSAEQLQLDRDTLAESIREMTDARAAQPKRGPVLEEPDTNFTGNVWNAQRLQATAARPVAPPLTPVSKAPTSTRTPDE